MMRPRRYNKTRTGRRNIQERRIARKVYGKKTVWMVR